MSAVVAAEAAVGLLSTVLQLAPEAAAAGPLLMQALAGQPWTAEQQAQALALTEQLNAAVAARAAAVEGQAPGGGVQ